MTEIKKIKMAKWRIRDESRCWDNKTDGEQKDYRNDWELRRELIERKKRYIITEKKTRRIWKRGRQWKKKE